MNLDGEFPVLAPAADSGHLGQIMELLASQDPAIEKLSRSLMQASDNKMGELVTMGALTVAETCSKMTRQRSRLNNDLEEWVTVSAMLYKNRKGAFMACSACCHDSVRLSEEGIDVAPHVIIGIVRVVAGVVALTDQIGAILHRHLARPALRLPGVDAALCAGRDGAAAAIVAFVVTNRPVWQRRTVVPVIVAPPKGSWTRIPAPGLSWTMLSWMTAMPSTTTAGAVQSWTVHFCSSSLAPSLTAAQVAVLHRRRPLLHAHGAAVAALSGPHRHLLDHHAFGTRLHGELVVGGPCDRGLAGRGGRDDPWLARRSSCRERAPCLLLLLGHRLPVEPPERRTTSRLFTVFM